MRTLAAASFSLLLALALAAPAPCQSPAISLARTYKAGDTLKYKMQANNDGWKYEVQATSVTRRDPGGIFYEEITWSNFHSEGEQTPSTPTAEVQQQLSLDPSGTYLSIPDLSRLDPKFIGPITDLLTIYSDLFLAHKEGLSTPGQHQYFKHDQPNSWADGTHILLGEDAIAFDLTLQTITPADHTATLLVRHVPPASAIVKLPAKWMEAPVGKLPNNWVQIAKESDHYTAQVGQEDFTVTLVLDTHDGKILSAALHNPLSIVTRDCQDAALTHCAEAKPSTILREVDLTLLP